MTVSLFIWQSEVKDSELDAQAIVNNAVYFTYLEHTRHKYFKAKGFDFIKFHEQGIDLVLTHSDIYYKNSLRSSDEFTVSLKIEKITATRLIIYQEISKLSTHTHKVILTAMNTIVCINRHNKLSHKQ
ncbi:hypothetical protein AVI51_03205 [Piscirickettsia salmonis]|uniref:Acyl-CoA thioesterase YbgC n=1 Tax=Piscirickettsia salmonis TaxID=1238 RepID=A0A9Q5YK65_PISSA|nr:thioesterase family protein [Piscirickettsia salmonis]ALA25078.1 thioesterase superfamily protein [Piscirickettsia salmonis]APS45359.1 hypothetical protein AVI48_13920 [Piscirickettsia salmonis]APS48719.1 hypothetical protein AVI49_14530 [Piscirickettsia salmonis]APS49961.1 hypothetical protein AVI50_03245 [Piscirickettsia salmonis]APS53155.1 hypothetical protein AVI51_03205 [Piscirickettsia salmonis]